MPQKLTNEMITAAIAGFEQQKLHIDAQIAELQAMGSGGPATPAAKPATAKKTRRKMSAAGRASIAEAQRKRWAKKSKAVTPEAPKKRHMSAAGRKAISDATKRRWALIRAAEAETAKPAATKKTASRKAASKKAAAKETVG